MIDMVDNSIQIQINELNRKMDLILESLNRQNQQNEAVEDLFRDLAIVGKDAFQTAVDELTVQNIVVDGEDVKHLAFKILRNIKRFGELMDMLESAMDFINDAAPIVHDAGIAVTKSLESLEEKGYFSYFKQLGLLASDLKDVITEQDIIKLRENLPVLGSILRNLTQPDVLKSAQRLTELLSTLEMDEKLDNKSLFKLMREINKPEVRRTLSFTLRLVGEIGKNSKSNQ
jgi:uncharacterized protein YjgD (DUF1641 family)